MALKQTRRSISVRGTTYDKLRQYGETHDRSMSDIVEELLATILGPDQAKPVAVAPPVPAVRDREKSEARLRFNPPPMQRPRPTVANHVVRAVAPPPRPPEQRPQLAGRPAPTPASQVIKVRQEEAFEKDDYRAIRF